MINKYTESQTYHKSEYDFSEGDQREIPLKEISSFELYRTMCIRNGIVPVSDPSELEKLLREKGLDADYGSTDTGGNKKMKEGCNYLHQQNL
jgi:hypothetical protein